MTTTRRRFLSALTASGAALPLVARAAAAPRPAKPLRILVLGETGFLGPHFVRAALAAGHEVTLFNRGKTDPGLFKDLEQLRGDREKQQLEPLKGRDWDAVVDTSAYVPAHVRQAAEVLRDRVGHYQVISTISVYNPFRDQPPEIDESAATSTAPQEVVDAVTTIRAAYGHYGAMKALCEQAAEAAMPGRVSRLRPGLIVGPRDRTDRFTYWPTRMQRGGEVLCPGRPEDVTQFIDVRDLAEFMLRCVERDVTGVYNAVGFAGRTTFGELMAACKCASSADVQLTWVDEEFLLANEVRPFVEMAMWVPSASQRWVRNDAGRAQGMRFRPIADTIRDTLEWAGSARGAAPMRAGLAAARERELLAKWSERR